MKKLSSKPDRDAGKVEIAINGIEIHIEKPKKSQRKTDSKQDNRMSELVLEVLERGRGIFGA